MNPRGVHRATTLVLSSALVVLGVALIVQGVAASHGVDATRLVLGACSSRPGPPASSSSSVAVGTGVETLARDLTTIV